MRLAIAAPRTFAWSALCVPDGNSTSGASRGGAGAGTVGQARTSTPPIAAASRRRIRARTWWALTLAAAGNSIRYLSRPRPIGLSSGLSVLRRLGLSPLRPSVLAIRTVASAAASSPGRSTSTSSPPVSSRSAVIASSQASRTSGATSSVMESRTIPIRSPPASPPASSSPNRTEPSRRQSAASAQSGPETIVVETAAMWCPAIAERPKVGFNPVRPQ